MLSPLLVSPPVSADMALLVDASFVGRFAAVSTAKRGAGRESHRRDVAREPMLRNHFGRAFPPPAPSVTKSCVVSLALELEHAAHAVFAGAAVRVAAQRRDAHGDERPKHDPDRYAL